jgi:flagellar biosynthetic protein FliQ
VGADNGVELMSQMLITAMWICAPVLAVCLLVGLIVSVLQVVTQVQEMTLTFVPKLICAVLVLLMLSGWMLSKWQGFAEDVIKSIGQL